jgi:hypothetical protein
MAIRKKLWVFLLLFCHTAFAQTDSSHLRISLLTCGSGPQPWETFGHTAVRITDSLSGTDNVYNYGTFNGYDENFLIKFTRGKLLYYLSYYPYPDFLNEYVQSDRSVSEQELLLTGEEKIAFYNFLIRNSRDENKYYKYDFFYDNCATRIRDIFPAVLGSRFHYPNVLPEGKKLTFRNIINQYFYRVHWQRFGVNIALGSRIDKVMSNEEIMFLPDFLEKGIAQATLNNHTIAAPSTVKFKGISNLPAGINAPFIFTFCIAFFTLIGLFIPSLHRLRSVMVFFNLFLTGFIGCFLLFLWWGTDHQACGNNFNLLWALPTNLLIAFAPKRNKSRYALIAMIFILISLVLHLLHVQELPLLELSPLLISLFFVHGFVYRKATTTTKNKA